MSKQREFYHVSLKAILKNIKGEVLILKADGSGTFAGFYDLPGGRIDEDEFDVSLVDILKREVKEEIGTGDISIIEKPVAVGRHRILAKHNSNGKDIPVLYLFYETFLNGGIVVTSEEHQGYEWVDLDNIDLKKYFTSGILEGLRMYLGK